MIGIIVAAITLAAVLVSGQWAMRRDIATLSERMAKVEGLFGGFTKSSPQSTPQRDADLRSICVLLLNA